MSQDFPATEFVRPVGEPEEWAADLVLGEYPAAVLGAAPTFPAELKPKPLFEASFELTDIAPELIDLLMWGESPGPHIVLGEN